MLPPGLLAGSEVSVNWDIRCEANFNQYDTSWHQFLGHWILRLGSRLAIFAHTPYPNGSVVLFLDVPVSLRDKGVPNHPLLDPQPATPPPPRSEWRRRAKHDRNIAQSSTVVEAIEKLESEGFTIVYLDGSSQKVHGIGWAGGYDIFVDSKIPFGAVRPPDSRQTNNTAELTAAVKAHRIFPRGKVAICTDLDYVLLGATGLARRWKARGWVGSSGPVYNEL